MPHRVQQVRMPFLTRPSLLLSCRDFALARICLFIHEALVRVAIRLDTHDPEVSRWNSLVAEIRRKPAHAGAGMESGAHLRRGSRARGFRTPPVPSGARNGA